MSTKASKRSLKGKQHELADSLIQLKVLNDKDLVDIQMPSFADSMREHELFPLYPTGIDIFQINMGKMCNQVCAHCHVDAGPDRKEIMSKAHLEKCLEILAATNIPTVDLTGGAPEMNPHFRWFVKEVHRLGCKVIDRCNLTIITANKSYNDLPEFFSEHGVEVVASMPHYNKLRTDRQRGDGVFERSIKGLQMLNAVGYGQVGSGLNLHLVYNPSGAFLPDLQENLSAEFKRQLKRKYDIVFNELFAITNMPISRFLDYLLQSGNYGEYMQQLIEAFNPQAAKGVMCRNTLSVSWDGYLYDCDFNQMLELKVEQSAPQHINDFDWQALVDRKIILNQHCYGCTAGAGSSCGGETV